MVQGSEVGEGVGDTDLQQPKSKVQRLSKQKAAKAESKPDEIETARETRTSRSHKSDNLEQHVIKPVLTEETPERKDEQQVIKEKITMENEKKSKQGGKGAKVGETKHQKKLSQSRLHSFQGTYSKLFNALEFS